MDQSNAGFDFDNVRRSALKPTFPPAPVCAFLEIVLFLLFRLLFVLLTPVASRRNAMLEASGVKLPKVLKTGTTIVGLIYKVRHQC